MTSSLEDKLSLILEEKTTKIIPTNIKKDVQIFDVVGTYEGEGSSSGVKLFETEEEMQADTTAKEGDLAVVYRNEVNNMTADTQTQYITFPETVTLPEAFTSNVNGMLRAVDPSVMFNGQVQLSKTSFRFDGFTDTGMIMVSYTSSDGITYTREEFRGDSGDLTNPVDLGTIIRYEPMEPWDDNLGYFMQLNTNTFDGLYKYGDFLNGYSIQGFGGINIISSSEVQSEQISLDISKYISAMNNILGDTSTSSKKASFIQMDDKLYMIKGDLSIWILLDDLNVRIQNPVSDSTSDIQCYVLNTDGSYTSETFAVDTDKYREYSGTKWYLSLQTFGSNTTFFSTTLVKNGVPNHNVNGQAAQVYIRSLENKTNNQKNLTSTDCNVTPVYIKKYVPAPNQLTALSENIYNSTAYSKDGLIEGTLTQNVSNSFADINAEIYAKIQLVYDNTEPRVLTDDNKTIDTSIYTIPTKSDGTSLLDTSQVTNMNTMFLGCNNLITIPLLDTSKVTSMNGMFRACNNLITVPLLDTSKVTSMSTMFRACSNIQTIPLLNTSLVTDMNTMFRGCSIIQTIPQLDTSKVTDMSYMFYDCTNLTTIPLLNTSKVTKMSNMFENCSNLTTIPELDTSLVTNIRRMFYGCKSLTTIPLLNTSKVTDMSYMFSDCSNLSDDSLNNVLASLLTATSYTSTKTLKYIGLSEEQATKCTTLSNWQACVSSGWTTGY